MPELKYNEQRVLDYLLEQPKDEDNRMILGLNSYEAIDGISASEFVTHLKSLDANRYINYHPKNPTNLEGAPCYLFLLPRAFN